MPEYLKIILSLAVGYLLGAYVRRLIGFCRKVYWHHKLKICWRYQPTGKRENRNGTVSDFCQRCGHSYGYP